MARGQASRRPDGLVRITLKKAYAEREACPRGMGRSRSTWTHSRSCAGWPARSLPLGDERTPSALPHNPLRRGSRSSESMALANQRAASPRGTPPSPPNAESEEPEKRVRKSGYRPWAELLERTFAVDVARGQASRFSPVPVARGG